MEDYYESHNANIHRGVYPLAVEATDAFEGARERVAALARRRRPRRRSSPRTRPRRSTSSPTRGAGATSAPATAIVLTQMEHHSNIVPWQLLCERGPARRCATWRSTTTGGSRSTRSTPSWPRATCGWWRSPTSRTCSARSTRWPRSPPRARGRRRSSLVDGAQAVPQIPVDVGAIGADFYGWTGHKAYGPTGVGVLHGRRELLEAMPPFLGGGRHDQLGRLPGARAGTSCPGSSRPARRRSPRRSAWAPRSTSCRASAWTPCARTSASSPPTRSSASAAVARPARLGPRDAGRPRRARRVRARRRAPARRRRDPRRARASASAPATTARSR